MAEKAIAAQTARGIDSSAFLTMANSNTFLAPIANNGARINELVNGAIESILLGKDDAQDALTKVNKKVLKLNK